MALVEIGNPFRRVEDVGLSKSEIRYLGQARYLGMALPWRPEPLDAMPSCFEIKQMKHSRLST